MEITQKLDCKDLHGYVLMLPASVLEQLYAHPATCLAIFRFVHYYAELAISNLQPAGPPAAAKPGDWMKLVTCSTAAI